MLLIVKFVFWCHIIQVPVTEQELKGKSRKKDVEKTSKSGDEQDEKNQSACEGKVCRNEKLISYIILRNQY